MARARLGALALVAIAVVAAGAFAIVTLSSGPASGPKRSAPSPSESPESRAAPAVPDNGAYFGAWVHEGAYTQASQILGLQTLQDSLGRRLDVVHTYLTWQGVFPTQSDQMALRQGSLLLLSWAGISSRAAASGEYDSVIRLRAEEIKATRRPIFLEWRWEMNRPNLTTIVGSPAEFIAAWTHVRTIFTQEHVNNVAWVWCPTAQGFGSGANAAAYYPGDSQVDWLCADVYPGVGPYRSFSVAAGPFLGWASHHHKPVMIGEFGVPQRYGSQLRAQWLREAAAAVQGDAQIKALVYFDADPAHVAADQSPALIYGTPAMQVFEQIAREPYFNPQGLHASR